MAIEEIIGLDIPVNDALRVDIYERVLFVVKYRILIGIGPRWQRTSITFITRLTASSVNLPRVFRRSSSSPPEYRGNVI